MSINSAAEDVPPGRPGPPAGAARWAGGGTSSNSTSLKCPSFIATANVPTWPLPHCNKRQKVIIATLSVIFMACGPRIALTAGLLTQLSANFHLGCQGHYRYSDLIFYASFQRVKDVVGVACCERTENDHDLSGGMGWEMAIVKTDAVISKPYFWTTPFRCAPNLIVPRAISMAFCKLGSPAGSSLSRSAIDRSTS